MGQTPPRRKEENEGVGGNPLTRAGWPMARVRDLRIGHVGDFALSSIVGRNRTDKAAPLPRLVNFVPDHYDNHVPIFYIGIGVGEDHIATNRVTQEKPKLIA